METLYIKETQEYLSLLDELIEIKTKQKFYSILILDDI